MKLLWERVQPADRKDLQLTRVREDKTPIAA